jgi:SAM-dependent methyltransferase
LKDVVPTGFEKPTRGQLDDMSPDRELLWYDFADAWLRFPLNRVLDYGCGNGDFLERLADRSASRTGVDVDEDKIESASAVDGISVRVVRPDVPLPFDDASFDTVIIMEVIEHVADERAVLAELSRVLAPGGVLLLTTPHRGLLTFLDPGNLKFVAPGIHRFIHCTLLRQADYYEGRFGQSRIDDKNMVADFTTDQIPWHRHYRFETIRSYAPERLRVVGWAVYFPAFRALWTFRLVLKVLTLGRFNRLPRPLYAMYRKLSRLETRLGDQLVVMFRKPD